MLSGGNLSQVLPYRKPSKRPEPFFEPPPTATDLIFDGGAEYEKARITEMLYNLLRSGLIHETTNIDVPPWTQYYLKVADGAASQSVSSVVFNPILMAPPNDPSTIYTILLRFKETATLMGYSYIPVCFDMGLLTKALEIIWAHQSELSGVIPIEGGMHFLMSVFSGIGFLYGEAGLRQLLQESGVFAAGSTQQILSGKDFDRAIYGLKLVDEVLNSRFLLNFHKWCEQKGMNIPTEVAGLLRDLSDQMTLAATNSDIFTRTTESVKLNVLPLIQQFRNEGRATSPTFRFWDQFLTDVMLPLKTYLASSKLGQWSVNQTSKRDLLKLLFATNRTNYARYMPVLMMLMQRLPDEVAAAFKEGLFVAKLTDGKFNKVWLDYTLEATENKALKGSGGIIGLTLKGSVLNRWFLARPVTAIYSTNFTTMVRCSKKLSQEQDHEKCMTNSQVLRWNKDIAKMTHMFEGTFRDPFSLFEPPAHLINFANGCIAPPSVEDSLIGALDKGSTMALNFVQDRLIPEQGGKPRKSLYDPIPRSNVKTMSDMNKSVKVHNKNVSLNGEVMYLRLLAVNALKKVPLHRVLSFENSPEPLSIFADDGSSLTCVKSQFMQKLEMLLPGDKVISVSGSDTIIFDGHAITQKLHGPSATETVTFKDMALNFFRHIVHVSQQHGNIKQIHVVFDRYDKVSPKNITRQKRTSGHEGQEYHVQLDVQAPRNWNVFLNRGENKSSLAKCYIEFMKHHAAIFLHDNQELYTSGGSRETACRITKQESVFWPDVASKQEEADTRIILHSVHASEKGAQQIIVDSPDTDVLVLLLHHRPAIHAHKVFFLTGHMGKYASLTRYIPVHLLHDKLSVEQHNILLPVYCITGCDTVSSFHGYGKAKAFKLMMEKSGHHQSLRDLGTDQIISRSVREACTGFVGSLYGRTGCNSMNALRCEEAAKKVTPRKLPPTEDSFQQHVLRTLYQLLIWRQANSLFQVLPDPIYFGYFKDLDGSLRPVMMTQSPAAPELLNDLVCQCTNNSCNSNCTCLNNNQPCTSACSCEAKLPGDESDHLCTNSLTLSALYEDDSDSDVED